jgi:hypothetical protein
MTFRKDPTGFLGTIFIRIAVGLIFSTQGILKYIDPKMALRADRVSQARLYRAFCRNVRDRLRAAGAGWNVDSHRCDSSSNHHLHGHSNHEDSGVNPRWPGILVLGGRRTHRFCHADVPPFLTLSGTRTGADDSEPRKEP